MYATILATKLETPSKFFSRYSSQCREVERLIKFNETSLNQTNISHGLGRTVNDI